MLLPVKRWLSWIIPGMLILTGGCYLWSAQNAQASAAVITPVPRQNTEVPLHTKAPIRMRIAAVGLDLAVQKGKYDARLGQWDINDKDAFFALGTTTPLIYGHNRQAIFEPIGRVQKGDRLQLTYANRSTATYTYFGTRFIAPDDASILTENDSRTIILFTCSGLFSDSRRVVYFKAVE